MAFTTRYAKPNMANLPPVLGKTIFHQIMNTPKPDEEQLNKEANKLEKEMIRVRDREDAHL